MDWENGLGTLDDTRFVTLVFFWLSFVLHVPLIYVSILFAIVPMYYINIMCLSFFPRIRCVKYIFFSEGQGTWNAGTR